MSLLRINYDKKSVYQQDNTSFKLEVIEKKYQNNKYSIIFSGKEKIISTINDFPYDIGDILEVKGKLVKVEKNVIPNTFNYQKYLQSRGINWKLEIEEMWLLQKNKNVFNSLKTGITKYFNNLRYREYYYAFIIGDTSYFDNNIRNSYQSVGLSYLLSIGSLQVMFIMNFIERIEMKIKIKKRNKLLINIFIIIFYIFFTNGIIGVLRSGLCYILRKILRYFNIRYRGYDIILIIGGILLLFNPYYINNTGFIYSFSISLAISLLGKRIKGTYIKKSFIFSVIAFLIGMPLTIYSNYEINFLAIFYSFIFVIIFNYILFPLCIISFVFPFTSFLFYFFINFVEKVINILTKIDFFVFSFYSISFLILVIYYIVIILCLNKKKFFILLFFIIVFHININCIINNNFVTFLNVSEGDSIVLKSNNHVILIDTGGNIYSKYYLDIIKYLKSYGISKINWLIISHGDFDHMGEAINLVNNFKVEKVIFNCGEFNDLEQELIKVLDKKRIKYYSCIKELKIDSNKLYFLQTKEYDNENDNSNVIYTELNGYKFMFMGDASKTTEKEILNKYNLPDIDVLKVGHHGSKTSSGIDFINEINPKYSIISVGKNNRYGHPNKEVLDNLENSKIYRTDEDGSIMFKIKNNKLKIETCSP